MAEEIKNNQEMGWDDSIENDGEDLVLLEEGDYNFEVINFERGRFPGGQKIPPCNKASITAEINTIKGRTVVKFDLILFRSVEFKVCAFFRCIGQKKHGEELKMDWTKVKGSKGRAHFTQKTYTNSHGETKTINVLGKFIDYDEKFFKIDDKDLPF